ncbi:hypothetical protein HPB47_026851 [Ixodes persulcatus]|uniref:Uncharacterized protein n=1 Tax=Ixodes persulcatus TaxID=34615 RepID=A0AC60PXK3_IXOPE|nr:hypothetical protein HPB47_026851 [Ixodes persulcatus]
MDHQLAQVHTLLQFISSTWGSFHCSPCYQPDIYFINAIAITEVKARHCAYALRTGCYPGEILSLFQVPPSMGHAKRITKILRAETWRQARLLQESLKVWCYSVYKEERVAEWKFKECRRLASQNTEFLWRRLLLSLPKPSKITKTGVCDVIIVGDTNVPEEVVKILEKGPKFACETSLKPPEMLTLVRNVGDRAQQDERERCILDGVDALPRRRGAPKGPNVGKVVSFCLEERLKLMLADKEGGFVLVPEGGFASSARPARLGYTSFQLRSRRSQSYKRELRAFSIPAKHARSCTASTVLGHMLALVASAASGPKLKRSIGG